MTTATPAPGDTASFAELGLEAELVEALTDQGITAPFPIQELTLNLALAGADIIGQARTGTGKTLAFGLPLLQHVDVARDHVQALVIVPTRELCLQVAEDLERAGRVKRVRVLAAYGGKSLDAQIDRLADEGVHVVVGTPGRLLDLLRRGVMDLARVRGLVLDEADEMLDLGFLPDVEQLIEATPARQQTLLFSATMPSAVVALARRYMDRPTFLRADVEQVHIAPQTEQHFFSCHRMDKPAVLARILQSPERGLCVVFCRTKRMCDILADELRERGIAAAPIHSDLRQESREKALSRFRSGKIDVLVATEVAARGLDIDDVTHVVNYDCPDDEKMYLHRIGRTGRAGAAGVAVTLAVWNELARLNMIKRALDIEAETHEVFSTSPILEELFDLPPRQERARTAARPPKDAQEERSGSRGGAREGGRRSSRGRAADRPSDDDAAEPRTTRREKGDGPRRARQEADTARPTRRETDTSRREEPADGADEAPAVRRRTRTREKPAAGEGGADVGAQKPRGARRDVTAGVDEGAPGAAAARDTAGAQQEETDEGAQRVQQGEETGSQRSRRRTRSRAEGTSGSARHGTTPAAGLAATDAAREDGRAPEDERATEAAADPDRGEAGEGPRSRTRVRTRSTRGRSHSQRGGAGETAREPDEASTTADGEVRGEGAHRDREVRGGRAGTDRRAETAAAEGRNRDATAAEERGDGEAAGRRGASRSRSRKKTSRGRTSGSGRSGTGSRGANAPRGETAARSGSGSRGGNGSRGDGGSRTRSGGGNAAGATPVSTEAARGEGRPRLRRPLEVAHLP